MKTLLTLFSCFFFFTAIAQEDTTVYMLANKMPQYGKGKADLLRYVLDNLQWPADMIDDLEARKKGIYAQFIVEKDGSLSHIQVQRSTHPSLTRAVEDLLATMPKWSPGKQNNLPVRVMYGLPIDFAAQQRTIITTTTIRSANSGEVISKERSSSTQKIIQPKKKPVAKKAPIKRSAPVKKK